MRIPSLNQVLYVFVTLLVVTPAAVGQETAPAAGAEKEDGGWLVSSPFVNVGWPELKMPKVDWTPGWGDKDKSGEPGFLDGSVAKVRSAARGAAQKTKAAWNKTVDRFKIRGEQKPASDEPGFFARLFSPSEPEPAGPQTIQQFLAQERPGSLRR